MVIQLLIGIIPYLVVALGWVWIFDSRIEPKIRSWIGNKYHVSIKVKAITRGYWWEVNGYSLTPLKIHFWAVIILVGVRFSTVMFVLISVGKIIRLLTNQ